MAKPSRDTGLTLMQSHPSRELLLEKMRGKLATTRSSAQVATEHKREVHKRVTASWTMRVIALIALCALNYFIIGNRDVIAAKLHKPSVPRMPIAEQTASPDDQALYYVYALYDYPLWQKKFGLTGFFAVDQGLARRKLDELLPQVTPRTLGEISKYMPVAFKNGPPGKPED